MVNLGHQNQTYLYSASGCKMFTKFFNMLLHKSVAAKPKEKEIVMSEAVADPALPTGTILPTDGTVLPVPTEPTKTVFETAVAKLQDLVASGKTAEAELIALAGKYL